MEENTINVWTFTQIDESVVILVSDLMSDRLWMEKENLEGFTPWMWAAATDLYERDPKIVSEFVQGRGRVDMNRVLRIHYDRVEIQGDLPRYPL